MKKFYKKNYCLLFLIISFFLSANITKSQSNFVLQYSPYPHNLELIHKKDNNLIMFLKIESNALAFLKTDTLGNIINQNMITYPNFNKGIGIIEFDSGYYILCNAKIPVVNNPTSYTLSYFVIKLNFHLEVIWIKQFGYSDSANDFRSICASENGGFLISAAGCSGFNIIVSCNSNGDILWQKKYYKTSNYPYPNTILKDNANNYIICSDCSDCDLTIFKINSSGNLLRYKTFNNLKVFHTKMIKSNDNGYTIAAYSYNFHKILYLIHLDSNLNTVWMNQYTHNNDFKTKGLIQLMNNNYIFYGYMTINNINNAFYGSVDEDGNFLWAKSDGAINTFSSFIEDINSAVAFGNNFYFSLKSYTGESLVKLNNNGIGFCHSYDIFLSTDDFYYNSIENPLINISVNFFTSDTAVYIRDAENKVYKSSVCENSNNIESFSSLLTSISTFPNPAINQLNIHYQSDFDLIFNLYNVLGIKQKSIFLNKNSNSHCIDVSGMPNGIYFYTISDTSNKSIKSDKIIISR